jgi:hypothetical protein
MKLLALRWRFSIRASGLVTTAELSKRSNAAERDFLRHLHER